MSMSLQPVSRVTTILVRCTSRHVNVGVFARRSSSARSSAVNSIETVELRGTTPKVRRTPPTSFTNTPPDFRWRPLVRRGPSAACRSSREQPQIPQAGRRPSVAAFRGAREVGAQAPDDRGRRASGGPDPRRPATSSRARTSIPGPRRVCLLEQAIHPCGETSGSTSNFHPSPRALSNALISRRKPRPPADTDRRQDPVAGC